MIVLKKLSKYFRIILFLGIIPLYSMDLDSFYQQVHKQSLQKNYIHFRHRKLLSLEAYHLLTPQEKLSLKYSLILVSSQIESFIYLNTLSGVGISTQKGSHLQFDIKYYETLKDIGIGGKFHAMCVLPYFDKCILLGFEAF